MTRGAENTTLAVEQSRMEIECILTRYGAEWFAGAHAGNRVLSRLCGTEAKNIREGCRCFDCAEAGRRGRARRRAAPAAWVSGEDTLDNIRKLTSAGYSYRRIALGTGLSAKTIQRIRAGQPLICRQTAEAVATFYNQVFWQLVTQPRVAGSQAVMEAVAALIGRRADWQGQGLCRDPQYPQEWFFPARGADTEPGRAVCRGCPVMDECRAYGLGQSGLHGIWGGLTGADRRELRGEAADEHLADDIEGVG